MATLPQGTVALVFTDIEGSTRLLQTLGDAYEDVLATHRRLLRDAFRSHAGVEVDTQGDALFYAFGKAHDAIAAAVQAQRALSSRDFEEGVELRVRMGMHTGEPTVTQEGYVGQDVHLGARICAASWGGQIVVSSATAGLLSSGLEDITLRPLGDHALKDIDERVELYQVVAPGLREDFPVLRTVGTHPTNLPPRLPLLIGRQEELAALKELLGSPSRRQAEGSGPLAPPPLRPALSCRRLRVVPSRFGSDGRGLRHDPPLFPLPPCGCRKLDQGRNQDLRQRLPGTRRGLTWLTDQSARAIKSQPEVEGLESSPRLALPTSMLALCRASSLRARRRIRRSKDRSSSAPTGTRFGRRGHDLRPRSAVAEGAMSSISSPGYLPLYPRLRSVERFLSGIVIAKAASFG